MKSNKQSRKEWAKVIAASLVTALVLNNTVSIYAEDGGAISPSPSAVVEETPVSTPVPAVEPTAVVPQETPEPTVEVTQQPADTGNESGSDETSVDATPVSTTEGQVSPTPTVEPENTETGEVPTATPVEGNGENVGADTEASPELSPGAMPETSPEVSPSVSPRTTPEADASPSVSPSVSPSATPSATPTAEVGINAAVTCDEAGISGEGINKITIHFETEGLAEEDSFDLVLSTENEQVTISGNAFSSKEDGAYYISALQANALDIIFNQLAGDAFTVQASGENIDFAYSTSGELAETEDGLCAEVTISVSSVDAEDEEVEITDEEILEETSEENTEVVLTEQSLAAHTSDDAWVYISGLLPEGATVTAVPVSVEVEGKVVLAAYDITILDADGNVYEITEAVTVSITAPVLKETEAEEVSVYHMADENAQAEKVADVGINYNKVSFEAEGFSIYILTEDEELDKSDNDNNETDGKFNISSYVDAQLQGSSDGLSRNDTLTFDFTYEIAGDALATAKENLTWYYSLESVLSGPNAVFKSIVDGGTGYIFDAENSSLMAGEYKIVGDVVEFHIYESYIKDRENVKGTFTLDCQLDENKVGSETQKEIAFDGDTVTVTFENVSVTTTKKVNGVAGDAGEVKVNDDYTIPYEIVVTPNASLNSLVLTDTLSPGQTIKDGKVTVEVQSPNGWKWAHVSVTPVNGTFQIDLAGLKDDNQNPITVEAGTTYKITYNTVIDNEYYGTALTNNASWDWTGDGTADSSDSTSITPIKKVNLSQKSVVKGEDGEGNTIFTYTITVGDGSTDLGGYSIQDTISLNQQPVGSYAVMTNGNGSQIQIDFAEDLAYGTSGEAVLFTHTFTAGQTGPYTITYQTKLCKGESLTGWQSINNKLETHKDGTAVEWDSTYENVDFGGLQSVGVDKEFSEMDLQNHLIWWEITVTLPDDTVIDNAVIQESDFKYNKEWTDYYMEIDWSQVTVSSKSTGAALDANAYTVDSVNDQITIASLTEAVVVRVPVKCPAEAIENDVVFQNTAVVRTGSTELGRDSAEYTYKADYEMTKFVKTPYNPETGLIEWEIDVNPNKLTYDPDILVYVTDTIPEGMTYYSDGEKDAYCYYEYSNFQNGSNKLNLEWVAQDTWKAEIGNLSGTKYCITYWTKVTTGNPETETFTNKADLYRSDGTFLTNADSTVTITHELLDKTHKQNKDIITYTIDVNKEAMDLSDDDKLVLMDQIPDGVELVINNQKGTVVFTDMKTGLQITNNVSYNYQNRNLVITVPDNKYIRITYDVRVNEISDMAQSISNTVTLSGKVNASDTDEGSFVVSSHSSTITGDNLGKLVINKLDSASLSTTLQGATFEVVKYTLSDDESAVEAETVTTAENNTTDETGVLKVAVEAGCLYSWEEKSAPDGYVLEGAKNYFIVYNDMVTKADAEALVAKIKNVQGYENINVTYSEETINKAVTNAKELTGSAQLTIQKSFVNGQVLSDAEKAKITFVVTNSAGSLIKSIKYSDMTNGSYTLTNLPYDTYKVSELYASKDGYTLTTTYEVDSVSADVASATLTADKQQANVKITNKYEGAKLVITKSFAGVNLTEEEKNRVQFIVTGPNNYYRTFTYAEMTDGKMELENLPFGSYSVQEYCNAGNEYTVKTTYKVGSSYGVGTYAKAALSQDKAVETIAYNNTYSLGKLTLKKTFVGGENLTQDQKNALTFTVIGKDYNNEWANTIYGPVEYTYADLTAGMITLDVPFGYYTVTESNAEVEGYTVDTTYKVNSVAVDNATNVEIVNWDASKLSAYVEVINTYTEIPTEKTSVSVTKVWDDGEDQDGIRPGSVTVNLLADGEVVANKEVTLSAENNWSYTWSNLVKKKADDSVIVYTVEEVEPEGYTAVVTGDASVGYTITNTHETEKTAISVSKTWSDNDNQDGIRPQAVTVKLLADGTETGQTLELNAANNWAGRFANLDKYEGGQEIAYTVDEVVPDGYVATVTGDAALGYTVTNTHVPEKTSVKVTKKWQDNDNSDKKRPASITVQLFADGSQTPLKEQVIYPDGQGKWSYTFTDLNKYQNGAVIAYTVKEKVVPDGYTETITGNASDGYTITNTHEVEKISISGEKKWENTENGTLPDKIVVNLLRNGAKIQSKEVTASDNWVFSFTDLQKYVDGTEAVYTITEDPLAEYSTTITQDANGNYIITNKYVASTTSRTVKKIWVDSDNQDGKRTESITVRLMADGVAVAGKTAVLNAENNWEYTWGELPEYKDGTTDSIKYTVEETNVPDGYTVSTLSYDEDEEAATIITVTNTHIPETISINATKSWDDADNQDGIRPAFVTINLLKNGNVIASQQVTDGGNGNWTCAFDDLPKYENGQEITYTVEEAAVPDGYAVNITGDSGSGFVITNTHEPEKISISGTKTWDDDDNRDGKRPNSITVNLLADGVETQEVSVSADVNGVWEYNFTNLPKYKNGAEIVYTVTEDAVDKYTTTITKTDAGYDITNSYTPGKVSKSVEKIWDDGNDRDGIRPASITVQLTATDPDGIEEPQTYTATLNDGNDWKHTWANLPQYINGRELVYTVAEVGTITGYTSTSVVNGNTTIITNTHTPEVTEVKVTKIWDDAGNQDGKRPESISVKLLANGSVMGGGLVTELDNWEYTFTNLPKYINGVAVDYTVEETLPEGYELAGITGNAADGYVITNKHTPEVTEISGEKTWDDSNNADRKRPASITVNLLADGVKVAEKVVSANSKGEWKYTFANVAKYADGKEIVYTVSEEPIANYSTTVDGYNITNTYTPEVTSRSVEKVWDDNDNVNRPTSVKIQLLANGKATGDPVTLSAENDWKYTWSDLQLNANGKAISYTVKELDIPSGYRAIYTTEGTTLVVKNTTTPAPTPVPTPTPTATPTPGVTPTPTTTPDNGSTPTPDNNPAPTPKATATPSVSPSASPGVSPSATPGEPERTPSIERTPRPETTPEGRTTPTPDLLEDEPTVLTSVRVEEKGVKGAVRGARRGLEYAVLGRRRRPSTGDDPALLLWMLALAVAVGGNMTAGIMLAYTPCKPRRKRED